ncbi:fam-f protein [Plasmodium gallinaceum]|uniref:Fam-f protein n=1 Tax=Plasmodium gallinaceum TaxID=5849 RepID=A0A1J1GTA4_PLAGA|nr:fam-f protein [Plasmodium gallinaceum]CRG95528.1 fam-f protein [Plasmodium gallinaceum]
MESHLILVFYFNFLIVILKNVFFYSINPYHNIKKFELKFMHTKIQLIRNLADFFDVKDEDILNDQGISIKDLQLLYNSNLSKSENTSNEVDFEDLRTLFVKLVDKLFLTNYKECLESEKKHHNSLRNTLEGISRDLLSLLHSSLDNVKNHVNSIFQENNVSCEYELSMFNGIDISFLLGFPLRLDDSFVFFDNLDKKNSEFFSNFSKNISNYHIYIIRYLNKRVNRFPLKYNYTEDEVPVNSHSNVMGTLLKEFTKSILSHNEEKTDDMNSPLKIDVHHINNLIDSTYRMLDATINLKTHALFVKLNKILNNDIKILIAFIAYILEIDYSSNKFTLEEIKENHGDEIFNDKILNNIYELFLQERDYIKKSLNKFKEYIQAIFGFDVNSLGIRSLVQKLYGSIDKKEIVEVFNVIVYSLFCKKQIDEYSDFIKSLKNESQDRRSGIGKFIYLFEKPHDNVFFIPKNKSSNLLLKFTEICKRNTFMNNLAHINEHLLSLDIYSENVKKFKAFIYLIHLINKELIELKEHYFTYGNGKLLRKNSILYLLHDIVRFNDSYIKYENNAMFS